MSASVLKDIQQNLDPELEKVFREHHAFVYRTAYGVTGRVEDADDVVQTVFLRPLRHEIPPDLTRNPRAYLSRDSLLDRFASTEICDDEFVDTQIPALTLRPFRFLWAAGIALTAVLVSVLVWTQRLHRRRFPCLPFAPLSRARLGWKLESARMPIDVLVIDSVERPSEN